ncbi:MAG TPA: hypothetical protein VJZ77_14515 [Blastocatellia bacterium]|nr:hypothetical protein [Blastocatellia bacterium]
MSIESDPITGRMIGVCDECGKEITPDDTASVELYVEIVGNKLRQAGVCFLHDDCQEKFERVHPLTQQDLWRRVYSPKVLADSKSALDEFIDQSPVELPAHIKTILRDFKARVAQSIEEAKLEIIFNNADRRGMSDEKLAQALGKSITEIEAIHIAKLKKMAK